ncbi:hypothetical protein SAMN05216198_1241 [Halopseudomonas litoralis]|uniref:Esterase n=1 Tax=Halopseudomonas litoralis TaxID=797277 RepID=A0A1H1PP24_9GAMM|nr:alpha/beta hydrolase-fold protein [Halopseudomonas litoralis]SDS12845.1 hypothetical protein SAMN05216198_1241 [Halopseudomonas litoralis]
MKVLWRLLAMLSLCCIGSVKASALPTPDWRPAQLPQSEQTDQVSRFTRRSYRIFVSVPTAPPPASGYPVVYVLDGNAKFAPLALQARGAELGMGDGLGQPVIIVGIGYPIDGLYDFKARAEDYTPVLPDSQTERTAVRQSNAALFLRFIQEELKPLIASRFPVDPQQQSLFGHSYGGLFTLYTLFQMPDAFQNYIAASPSLWWDHPGLLSQLPELKRKLAVLPRSPRLLLTVGSAEEYSGEPVSAREVKLQGRRMRSNLDELYQALQPLQSQGLYSERLITADADHGTNASLTSLRVLSFVSGHRRCSVAGADKCSKYK